MNILANQSGPRARIESQAFTETVWAQALNHLAEVIGPDALKYAHVPAAKLVAAIGYLAGSQDADRFAVSNLLTFHGATKARTLFNHRPSDDTDVLRRLTTIQFGSWANPEVVAYGMNLLALISLKDHEHDLAADTKAGKYTPLTEGKWNVAALKKNLEGQLGVNKKLKDLYAEGVRFNPEEVSWWSA